MGGFTGFWEEDWDDTAKCSFSRRRLKKEINNRRLEDSAEIHACEMRNSPSWLEKRMMEFLENHNIEYEFQKVFYIKDPNGYIQRYFIADFFIPNRNLIIEMDGKYHKDQVDYDRVRTALIKKHYRKIKVARFTYYDVVSMDWEDIMKKINDVAYNNYRKKVRKLGKKKIGRIEARPSATG